MKKNIALFFILLVSYCFSTTVTYIKQTDAITLDPAKIDDTYSSEIAYNLYEGLVKIDNRTLEILPALAVSWRTIDKGKIWIFKLRKNVKFSDGTPFNSNAVVFSLYKRFINNKDIPYEIKSIVSKVKAINSYTVQITLKEVDYGFLMKLIDVPFLIVLKNKRNNKEYYLGTGPFELEKWEKDKYMILKKNKYYWENRVKIDKIKIKIVRDVYDKILEFKNKNGDFLKINSKREENILLNKQKVNYYSNKSLLVYYLGFNLKKKPFDNLLVRKAIAHLINKKKIVNFVFQDLALSTNTFIPRFVRGVKYNIDNYEFNLDKVKSLLEKAGYKNGFSFTLLIRKYNPDIKEFVAYFGKAALKIGIKIIIREISYLESIKILQNNNFDAYIAGFVTPPDPELFLEVNFLSNGSFNDRGYKNTKVDKLLKEAKTSSGKIRIKLYKKVQNILHKELPVIPLYFLRSKVISKKDVHGIKISPLRVILFKDMYRDKDY